MEKPPRTLPRPRWYHRYMVTECRTGVTPYPISYHATHWGAVSTHLTLIIDQEATDVGWPPRAPGTWWNVLRLTRC